MHKPSLILLVSLFSVSLQAGSFFGGMDRNALKDMILSRANGPSLPPPTFNLGGRVDWGIFSMVKNAIGGFSPGIQDLQSFDIPTQTVRQQMETALFYTKVGAGITAAVGTMVKAAGTTATGAADVAKATNDLQEQQKRAEAMQKSAGESTAEVVQTRPRSLSSERREAADQVGNLSLEESRYLAKQEELNNSASTYFRDLHFKRLNSLVQKTESPVTDSKNNI